MQTLAQVSENVFDSATGQRLLIPQGSRFIGSYQSAAGYGQQRVAIACLGLLLFISWLLRIRITLTDSAAAAGVYRVADSPPVRGALVAACLPGVIARQGLGRGYLQKGDCAAGAEPVAKVIGAMAGDVVDLEPGWVAINGVRFANSQTAGRDSAGRPLAHVLSGAHRVGSGEVWLFGFNNVRSWDARYFGPVPLANVRGVLRPVMTW